MFRFFKKKSFVVTHNARFHADDVFAVATLSLLLNGNIQIVRTRDEGFFSKGDYVVDVGGIYDSEKNRFDHHQKGGAGTREDGVPYASFGLVWKKFGEKVSGSKEIAEKIEKKLVESIDTYDNGFADSLPLVGDVYTYDIGLFLTSLSPTWKEGVSYDRSFVEAVDIAKKVLERVIIKLTHTKEAQATVVEAYKRTEDKRVVILDQDVPWQETIMQFEEPLFVISPKAGSTTWTIRTVKKQLHNFENRKDLPEIWAGLRGEALAKISGVSDASFCHNKLFLAVAESKEGAIALANKALTE